jgi:hypothetical protein
MHNKFQYMVESAKPSHWRNGHLSSLVDVMIRYGQFEDPELMNSLGYQVAGPS